jgi:uncharacterized LabA/DUF88 family protein
MERTYAFVDGAHLRNAACDFDGFMPNPRRLVEEILKSTAGTVTTGLGDNYVLRRTYYFDARPASESEANAELVEYWDALEAEPDVELGWGSIRGERRRRQKRVDTLLSVALLVGAYQQLFETAVLIAADEDFVPVVDEVRRLGVRVILAPIASRRTKVSRDLARSADRLIEWQPKLGWPLLQADNRKFGAVMALAQHD